MLAYAAVDGRRPVLDDAASVPTTSLLAKTLTDEQRLFGRTAAEFMRGEVLPREAGCTRTTGTLTRELLRKAGDLDLLRLGDS